MRELMGETKIGTLLQVPTMRLRAGELTALAPGMVLRLPLARHVISELRVGGLLFGHAHPVRTGEHRGAQLESSYTEEHRDELHRNEEAAEAVSVN